ncbi:MAG: anthranilate synthase component I family protein, partial [Candidatus Gastranaerophilales bacterium]|nr:anthranilate synthase component I family protein [Candidatus Gastranaerophilales bacterium]
MNIFADKLFKNPIEIIEANSKEEMKNAFALLDKYREKYYLLGYISYNFEELYFEVYDNFEKYIPDRVEKSYGIIAKPLISKEEYFDCIDKIKKYISEGITYEVNYTYPNEVLTNLDDFDLYEALLDKQKTPYNTFFKSDKKTILSFSPELFFRLKDNKIYTKPMKGTIERGKSPEEDNKNAEFLYNDIKNRAENVMIVDLLRNDLGRIAKAGSVKVDKLFDIEKHATLFQMTSEISAELEDNISLYDIFNAIFPCGSITGAPKVSTMKVIDSLEPFNRGVYCGAIGFLSPDECIFSVPIRILQSETGKNKSDKF